MNEMRQLIETVILNEGLSSDDIIILNRKIWLSNLKKDPDVTEYEDGELIDDESDDPWVDDPIVIYYEANICRMWTSIRVESPESNAYGMVSASAEGLDAAGLYNDDYLNWRGNLRLSSLV